MKPNCFKHKGLGSPDTRPTRLRITDAEGNYSVNTPLTQYVFKQTKSLSKFTGVVALWQSVQEWIRQEIVDDDPNDAETLSKADCHHRC